MRDPADAAQSPRRGCSTSPRTISLDAISDRNSGFAYLARKVDLATAERVRKLNIEGIGLLPDSRRVYPEGELASQVIGAVGLENQGLSGLEAITTTCSAAPTARPR